VIIDTTIANSTGTLRQQLPNATREEGVNLVMAAFDSMSDQPAISFHI